MWPKLWEQPTLLDLWSENGVKPDASTFNQTPFGKETELDKRAWVLILCLTAITFSLAAIILAWPA